VPVRIAVRPGQEPPPGSAGETVPLDFQDRTTFAAAVRGVERLFLLRPPQIARVRDTLNPFLDAAKSGGVRHIVFLSLMGAERNPFVPHRVVEQHLMRLGVPYTLLRPGFFMQNLSGTHAEDIVRYGEIIVPAGEGRTSFLDARDIAEAAAVVLTEPGHEGQAYTLTGAEALTYGEAAAILTKALGQTIAYRRPSLWRFVRYMRRRGFAWDFIGVMAGIYRTPANLVSAVRRRPPDGLAARLTAISKNHGAAAAQDTAPSPVNRQRELCLYV
jgi:uncharacterized protein YbjT (DUF2867 family)